MERLNLIVQEVREVKVLVEEWWRGGLLLLCRRSGIVALR
jgi:hypothetical protein